MRVTIASTRWPGATVTSCGVSPRLGPVSRASRVSAASRPRCRRRFRKLPLPPVARVGHRDRVEQRARIGVPRIGEDCGGRRLLDDAALVHHHHAVGQRAHDAEVVADEQHRQPHLVLQVLQQPDDLRLHRDVERRGRLVRHQHRRLEDQRPGDGDALALPARQFVRIALAEIAVEPDLFEPVERLLGLLARRANMPWMSSGSAMIWVSVIIGSSAE